MDSSQEIDIDKIVRSRMGSRARWLPRFVTRWLGRLIHIDFINSYLKQGREGIDFCEGVIEVLGVDLTVEGRENLPTDGRVCTFVSNHPLGAIDGVTLGGIIGRAYDGRIKYLVNDLLMNLPGLAPLCIPINKTGNQSRNFPAMVNAGFNSDYHMLMFPAGLCSRKTNGQIRDLPWKKTFISKSVQTQRDVVPIHFGGSNSEKFYRIANLCKTLGLKVNLAMLFLVDEMYKNVHKTFRVAIGKPIPWQTFDKSRTPAEWAQFVQDKVYEL